MASLPLAIVMNLALLHAPQVAPETIATFAQAESGLSPYALYDNTAKRSYQPRTAAEATALARSLLDEGHSIDTGLMQINSKNFGITGLDAVTAFDPAASIRASSVILVEAYQRCVSAKLTADPLRCMASIYNTGNHRRGEANGYVARIIAVAERLVPAIRQAVPEQPAPVPTAEKQALPTHGCGPPPPKWDGWAKVDYQRCVANSQTNTPTETIDDEKPNPSDDRS